MIPLNYIQEWRNHAPWSDMAQVEQDLIISRAICDLFNCNRLQGKVAFRGGTAIHKLLLQRPLRYSEDIDLVQTQAEPIGQTIDAVRESLNWLGRCRTRQSEHTTRLQFAFVPETFPGTTRNLKIEINTREQNNLYKIKKYPYWMNCTWHEANTEIHSYEPAELFGTKLRALLQRNKNRDLFDLYQGIEQCLLNFEKTVLCLEHYLKINDQTISRAEAEQRMLKKLYGNLTDDVAPMLPYGVQFDNNLALDAFNFIWSELIARISGEPWKVSEKVIDELRNSKYPSLLAS